MPKKVVGEAEDRLQFQNETLMQLFGLVLVAISWAPTLAIIWFCRSNVGMTEDVKNWNARMLSLAIGAIIAMPAPCMYFGLLCFSTRVVTAVCVAIPYTGVVWLVTVLVLLSIYGFNV
ncbi:MAG: hypothetical protein J0L78_04125 [Planctomycetes bacterium]|nr:hypothetical protein [Planctomycetota bacterium]